MIIFVLIIAGLCFFLCTNLLVNNRSLHLISSLFFGLLTTLSVILIIANFNNHFGMHKVTYTKSSVLASNSKDINVLLNQPIGTSGKDKVVIYKTNLNQKKPLNTSTDKTENRILQGETNARLVTKKTKWEYKNDSYKFWFDFAQKPNRYKTVNYFYIPKDWLNLTVKQAQALPKIIEKVKSQMGNSNNPQAMKQAAQSFVQSEVMKGMQQNPKMTAKEKNVLIKQSTAKFEQKAKQQAMAKMLPLIKKQLASVK
ncbi:hypothetical protein FD06_GL001425 [Apilactobacillus ozensis DSM 23829 = JCM 17196]|uniref:DUF4811 domain-containing protein n=1 Tax=Apilactobacillus ozensis DSM 23829 = JCM 17196 TaxID=1423781 RepID=A0A0R2AYF4_9LACO|nr:DUF4811 domain-containing protein [Apilactobacillus ozensis]KRM68211.1 hypothetical protein FD06_GL001425 [Apilactobacillus ozensis DSM 23829 = JCM 17196]